MEIVEEVHRRFRIFFIVSFVFSTFFFFILKMLFIFSSFHFFHSGFFFAVLHFFIFSLFPFLFNFFFFFFLLFFNVSFLLFFLFFCFFPFLRFFSVFLSTKFRCWHFLVSEFNCRCFLRSLCPMEMWCPDDTGRDSWDFVGATYWRERDESMHDSTP